MELSEIIIDPEFKAVIPSLTQDEFDRLEKAITDCGEHNYSIKESAKKEIQE